MEKQPHLCVTAEQIHPLVIVCGEPDRINRLAQLLDNPEYLGQNREYRLFNGYYQGQGVTLCSTGIGAPSLIIAIEELKNCGVQKVIRVGSAGALQHELQLGDLIVVDGAVRDDGGSASYVRASFPAVSNHELAAGMRAYLQANQIAHHCGVIRSHDSFYINEEAEVCAYWHKQGVLAADMETSALLTVGRLRGMQVASILNNVVRYQQDVQ